MRVCVYCGGGYDEKKGKCPGCGSTEFEYRCDNCGCQFQSHYCPNCGKSADQPMRTCPNCGRTTHNTYCQYCGTNMISGERSYSQQRPQQTYNTYNYQTYNQYQVPPNMRECNKWVTFLLCFFFGWWGVHKFYEHKIFLGILYIFTFAFLGIGWLVDIIKILLKPTTYYVRK